MKKIFTAVCLLGLWTGVAKADVFVTTGNLVLFGGSMIVSNWVGTSTEPVNSSSFQLLMPDGSSIPLSSSATPNPGINGNNWGISIFLTGTTPHGVADGTSVSLQVTTPSGDVAIGTVNCKLNTTFGSVRCF